MLPGGGVLKTPYTSWKGKLITVYPIHFITLFAALIFFPVSLFKYGKSAIINVLLNILLLQDFSKEPTTGNWVSWYLCVYLLCAIFTPIIIKAINESVMKANIILFVSLGTRYILESWQSAGYWEINFHYSPFIRLLEFIVSICYGYILLKVESAVQKKISSRIWFFVEIFVIFIYLLSYRYDMLRFWHITLSLIMVGVFFIEPANGGMNRICNNALIKSISNIQLEFYMIHQLVIRILRIFFLNIPKVHFGIICLFITIILAYLYKTFLKKPSERLMEEVFAKIETMWNAM